MNKKDFLDRLRNGLSGLPQEDIEERLSFYSEIINDRMEEGFTEEQAVSAVGTVEQIVSQIVAETPLSIITKQRIQRKKPYKTWEILLLILGSPIWLSLLIAAAAVVFSVCVSLWAVVISLWAAFAAVAGSALGGFLSGVGLVICGNGPSGYLLIAAGLVCAGLAIFLFFGCKASTKGMGVLTKNLGLWMKRLFIGKGDAR